MGVFTIKAKKSNSRRPPRVIQLYRERSLQPFIYRLGSGISIDYKFHTGCLRLILTNFIELEFMRLIPPWPCIGCYPRFKRHSTFKFLPQLSSFRWKSWKHASFRFLHGSYWILRHSCPRLRCLIFGHEIAIPSTEAKHFATVASSWQKQNMILI